MYYLVFPAILLGLWARKANASNLKWLAIGWSVLTFSVNLFLYGVNVKESFVALVSVTIIKTVLIYIWLRMLNYFEDKFIISLLILVIGAILLGY